MTEADDLIVIERCRRGDRRAWEELVEKYHRVVFSVAFRILNDRSEAEEITQAVFVKIVERLDDFDPRYKFFSWLYKISVNTTLNRRREKRGIESIPEEFQSHDKSPHATCEESDVSEGIQRALLELTEEYRAVVVLKHMQGLSYEEISEILNVPEKTVKSRLFSARSRLRSILVRNRI